MTRTETFTDAAFAFAVTLLVVSIDAVPGTHEELLVAISGIPAFAMSFGILFMFWYGHWNWSRRYGLEDLFSITLSFSLVFTVLCYVYPLKYVASVFVQWVTGDRLSVGGKIETVDQLYQLFGIYSVGFSAMCLILLMLYIHAWRLRDKLHLNPVESLITRAELGSWALLLTIGLLATGFGFLAPHHPLTMPVWAYVLLPVIMPIYGYMVGRRIKEKKRVHMPADQSQGGINQVP